MVGLRMYRKFFFGLLILAFSTRWATAAETFGTTVLTSGSRIEVPTTILPGRASAEQMTLYREKIERIRRHHLSLPTPIAFRQFSATLSANKQVVKPKLEASLSDGLDVTNRVAATTLAKMDYSYVSPVAEPSVAMVRENILVTFNWGAIWSGDSGKSFTQLDPFSLFTNPRPAVGNGFCCDQIAIYSEKYDLLVWLLQGSDDGSANTIRLLLAKGNDIAARRFQVRDFSPESVGSWSGEWFDFPDVALSDDHLFVSFNSFESGGGRGYARSSVMRFPLADLAAYRDARVSYFSSDSNEDFSPRFAQGPGSRMFWATHRDTGSLIVRSWPDGADQPDRRRIVSVEPFARPDDASVASAKAPNGRPWLNRLDERITAGWITTDTVGFAWSSGAIKGAPGVAEYPHPHVRVAIMSKAELETNSPSVLQPQAQPHIWSSRFAFAYPAASPNQAGDVGIGLFFGGPRHFPSSAIGVFRQDEGGWKTTMTVLATGKNTPRCVTSRGSDDRCGTWGDYMGIRPHPASPNSWIAVAQTAEDQSRNEQPKVVVSFSPFSLKKGTASVAAASAAESRR
jgi:hypothetical protein